MLKVLSLFFLISLVLVIANAFVEAQDGSVCFNNCNGNGDCIDYSCHCYIGFHGDDCGISFIEKGEKIIPILNAGHFNLTKKNFSSTINKNQLILVGFSTVDCHKCINMENEYEKISVKLKDLKIPFARSTPETMQLFTSDYSENDLPSLVLFIKARPLHIRDQSYEAVIEYISKLKDKPVRSIFSEDVVEAFLNGQLNVVSSLSKIFVVGFFSDPNGIEEDDYDEWFQIARKMQTKENIYFSSVTNKTLISQYKYNKYIDRTPSMIIQSENGLRSVMNLDELYGDGIGIEQYLINAAVPLVGYLTNANFKLYEQLNKPMLMLFLNLKNYDANMNSYSKSSSSSKVILPDRSGNILNQDLYDEFLLTAKEYKDNIAFVYLDGNKHANQMRSLGLFGGIERLPSLAFNTKTNSHLPFPEDLPINFDTLNQFCSDFINGKLNSRLDLVAMADRAPARTVPISSKNKAQRKEAKRAPATVKGVSEQLFDTAATRSHIVQLTADKVEQFVVDNDHKDILLLIYAHSSESCGHFAVYFKKMALRFWELKLPSLVLAALDVQMELPPPSLGLLTGSALMGSLPVLLLLPAHDKQPPYKVYSGVGKVQDMMQWVRSVAREPFILPAMPHLSTSEKEAYKVQVRDREEYLAKKRLEDDLAMREQEAAVLEMEGRRRRTVWEEADEEL